ncbi:chaperone NapD [Niveispirillum lacus]|nr:chaperone NapD [Niveispirillum lacus]
MNEDIHISSLVVHVRPDARDRVITRILSSGGDVVPTLGDDSRLVVVIECPSAGATADFLDIINAIAGVFSALPVYHHAEPAACLAEPMP